MVEYSNCFFGWLMVDASHGETPFVELTEFSVARSHTDRAVSHALLSRRSYAECHTTEVVSRDVGFRPAVPLPAVAIPLRALLVGAPTCISQGLNGLRLFGNHCLSFNRRTQLSERRSSPLRAHCGFQQHSGRRPTLVFTRRAVNRKHLHE